MRHFRCVLVLLGLAATCALGDDASETAVIRIGGTLGLTGEFAGPSLHCLHGLQLLQDFVNDEAPEPFKLSDGRRVTVELDIRDDEGSRLESQRLYQAMIAEGRVDMFVGPYTSSLSHDAAVVTNASGKVLMLHAAATPSIYREGFELVFSTNVMASEYMADGLRNLRKTWDQQDAAVSSRQPRLAVGRSCHIFPCLFNTAVCEGAERHGRDLGFDVETFSFDNIDLSRFVQEVMLHHPDIFVSCGHLADAINIIVTSRGLGFSPKAMLITQATGTDFIKAVGPPNANYLLSPVSWDHRRDLSCRIFGSASKFAASYQKKFGMEPEYHAAGAAAAGLALLAGVENVGRWPLSAAEVRQGLLNLNLQTFYRKLAFGTNGTLLGAEIYTQQVQPLGESRPPAERYAQSEVNLVGTMSGDKELLFPMPNWQDKELQIFPCEAGYVLDYKSENVSCLGCPKGTLRPSTELECRSCGVNYFNTKPGQASCAKCPVGADCGLEHPVVPFAQPGFYLLPESKDSLPVYEACIAGMCTGANKCIGHNTGVLCMVCKAGYTNRRTGFRGKTKVCRECPGVWMSLLTLLLVLIVFWCYAAGVAHMTSAAATSVRAIHCIVLKILVSYLQLTGTIVEATGLDSKPGLGLLLDFVDPFAALNVIECTLGEWAWMGHHEVVTIVGLLLIPVVLLANDVVFRVMFLRELRRVKQQAQMYGPSSVIANVPQSEHSPHLDKHSPTEALEAHASHSKQDPLHLRRQLLMRRMRKSRYHWAVVMVYLFYPVVIKMELEAVTCVEHDVLRLRHEKEVKCLAGQHSVWLTLSCFGLVLYGLGIPLAILFRLIRLKDELMTAKARKIYGFLYNGYSRQWFYYEVIIMIRKGLFLGLSAAPAPSVRTVQMLVASIVFLGVHLRCRPYDNRDNYTLARLETASLIAVISTLFWALSYEVLAELHEVVGELTWTLGLLSILIHCYFCALVIWSLLRNAFAKYLQFKAECMPDSISRFGRLLLRMQGHEGKVEFNAEQHCLDLSKLTTRERTCLVDSLCETMDWYVRTKTTFHPARLDTCLRLSMEISMKERKARARQVFEVVGGVVREQGLRAMLRGWQAEAGLAVRDWTSANNEDDLLPGATSKSKKIKGWKAALREVVLRVSEPVVPVSELQTALILCEYPVLSCEDEFFEIDRRPSKLASLVFGEDVGGDSSNELGPTRATYESVNQLLGSETASRFLPGDARSSGRADMDEVVHRAVNEVKLDPDVVLHRQDALVREACQLKAAAMRMQRQLAQLPNRAEETPSATAQRPADNTPYARELSRSVPEEGSLDVTLGEASRVKDMEEFLSSLIHQNNTARYWRYSPDNGAAIAIRSGPGLNDPVSGNTLLPGAIFRVSEERRGSSGITFLKLADGRGWVFDKRADIGVMCVRVDS